VPAGDALLKGRGKSERQTELRGKNQQEKSAGEGDGRNHISAGK